MDQQVKQERLQGRLGQKSKSFVNNVRPFN